MLIKNQQFNAYQYYRSQHCLSDFILDFKLYFNKIRLDLFPLSNFDNLSFQWQVTEIDDKSANAIYY